MQTVLDEAIEQYRRERFFRELDEGYARLQADPQAWQEELDERRLWDTTLADGHYLYGSPKREIHSDYKHSV